MIRFEYGTANITVKNPEQGDEIGITRHVKVKRDYSGGYQTTRQPKIQRSFTLKFKNITKQQQSDMACFFKMSAGKAFAYTDYTGETYTVKLSNTTLDLTINAAAFDKNLEGEINPSDFEVELICV